MSKKKRIRLAELETLSNVFQLRKDLKGMWNEIVFKNSNPITLELACGKGEYSLALAKKFPHRNFIGVDIKGARMWRGAKTALEENLINVAFLRAYIDHITEYFEKDEVVEIWITFPDPYPENSKAGKRLTSPVFLRRYREILKQNGIIHLKTDDLMLYQFTLNVIEETGCRLLFHSADIYTSRMPGDIYSVKTFYEEMHLGKGRTIKYISFKL